MALLSILLFLPPACNAQSSQTATPRPTSEVIATAYTSYMIGELVNSEGCIQVRSQISQVAYTLV